MDAGRFTEEQHGLLAESTNRAVVTVLDDADHPLDVATLAERLVDRDVEIVSADEYEDRIDRQRILLHHEHLPKLADAGLIEYDHESNVAAPARATAEVEWRPSASLSKVVPDLLSGGGEGDTGVITDEESIARYGRQLAEEAEKELFSIVVTADFLDMRCFESVQDALDRGVRVSIGCGDPDIRELARAHLPEATTWEPQLDWLNTPSYPRVGRLVLADRRKLMLSVLETPDEDGIDREARAVVGDGRDHPLVVLVRDLLGPRLDHLDRQSESFLEGPVP